MGLQHHGSSITARALTPEQLHAVLLPTAAVSVNGHGGHGLAQLVTHTSDVAHALLSVHSILLLQIDCSCQAALWTVNLPA